MLRDLFNILAGDFATELKNRIQASAKDVAMLLAATLLLVCGFVVFMFAGYVFLLQFMAPVYAALIIGGAFVLAALILLLAIKSDAAHPGDGKETDLGRAGESGIAGLEAEAMTYVQRHAKQATFMSLLAGVVVGSSPEIRRTLMHALDAALAERNAPEEKREDRRR